MIKLNHELKFWSETAFWRRCCYFQGACRLSGEQRRWRPLWICWFWMQTDEGGCLWRAEEPVSQSTSSEWGWVPQGGSRLDVNNQFWLWKITVYQFCKKNTEWKDRLHGCVCKWSIQFWPRRLLIIIPMFKQLSCLTALSDGWLFTLLPSAQQQWLSSRKHCNSMKQPCNKHNFYEAYSVELLTLSCLLPYMP